VVITIGRLLFAGPMADLLARTSEHIDVSPENPDDSARLRDVLTAAGWVVSSGAVSSGAVSSGVVADDGPGLRVDGPADQAPAVNRTAMAAGITLGLLVARQETLEDVFLRLTGSADGDLARQRAAQAHPTRPAAQRVHAVEETI